MMTLEETAEVLHHISQFDGRKITPEMIASWQHVFAKVRTVTKDAAIARIDQRLRNGDVRIVPSHLMPSPEEWTNGHYDGPYDTRGLDR